MKKLINALLVLVFMLALMASVTPRDMIANTFIQKNEVANVNFKIPLPVDVSPQANFAQSEAIQPESVINEK